MLTGRLMWVNYQDIPNCCRPVLTYWLTDWHRQWLTDYWSRTAFWRDSFPLLRQLCTVGHGIFYMPDVNTFLLVNKIMLISPDIYFKTVHNSFLHLLLNNGDFLNTDISQGSVATRLGCGVTNFLLSLTVKKLWKSVNIWWSYGQELRVLFFWLTEYNFGWFFSRRVCSCE